MIQSAAFPDYQVNFDSTPYVYSRSSPSGKAVEEDVLMDDNPAYGGVNIYDRYKGPSSVVYTKQNHLILSVHALFCTAEEGPIGVDASCQLGTVYHLLMRSRI